MKEEIKETLITFQVAKLAKEQIEYHVQEALKAASEKAECCVA